MTIYYLVVKKVDHPEDWMLVFTHHLCSQSIKHKEPKLKPERCIVGKFLPSVCLGTAVTRAKLHSKSGLEADALIFKAPS